MKKENGVMLWSELILTHFTTFIFSLFMILFSFGYLPMQHTEQPECEIVAFLNDRKAFFRLFFRPKTVRFVSLSLESEPTGKLPFHVRSPPVFYPLRRYENKWDFHQLMSTKSKMQSRRFCSQKNKQAVSLVDIVKSVGLFGEAISFLPLFWLYFNWRIHEYGDKVKVLISWKSVDFKPQFWWKSA